MRKLFRLTLRTLIVLFALFMVFTIYSFFSVPDLCDLQKMNPKITAFMELRKKQWKAKNAEHRINQNWVPLSAISPHLKNAVVVTEDPNFYHHHGLDLHAIRMALEEDLEHRRIVYGASTITQQLMKNLYLSPSENPLRKWREAILALRVERCVKKKRLLEVYLNVIEWGESIYGIEAASRKYFRKPAAALDPAEAALLTAMIPNPIFYNPYKRNPELIKNKNFTLKRMWKSGLLSRGEYETSVNERIRLH